jgi:RNA polymerase sigma factor (sigma-70 family)
MRAMTDASAALPPSGYRLEPISDSEPLPPEDRKAKDDAGRLVDALYRSESRALLSSMSRSVPSGDDAQDLVQEAFFRLTRLGHQALSLERPQAFLRRVAANLVKDRARSAARHRSELHIPLDEQALTAPDPVRMLESRDMLNRIEAAMMRLRPRTREIFMAHRIDGLSYAQIAERTGLSVKGVEKQMSKALQQLDRLLGR